MEVARSQARTLELECSSLLLDVRHLVLVMASERSASRLDGWGTEIVSAAASRVLVRQQQASGLALGFLALG